MSSYYNNPKFAHEAPFEPFSRVGGANSGVALTAGRTVMSFARPHRDVTITRLVSSSTTAYAGGTPTVCRMGVYLVDSSYNFTLLARTASDTNMWNTNNTLYKANLSATGGYPTSLDIKSGQLYALAAICVTVGTGPNLSGAFVGASALYGDTDFGDRVCSQVTSQSELAASYVSGDLSNTTVAPYIAGLL